MIFHEVRRYPLVGLMAGVVILACQPSVVANSYQITCQQPGSSFLTDEPVQFTIATDLPIQDLQWSITDHKGATIREGTIRVGADLPATLRARPNPGVGHYTLTLTPPSGPAVERIFCVLPPPDEARGDGGLFGIGGYFRSDTEWDLAARMGARHVRAEFAWPEVERSEGEYDLQWVEEFADAAERRDMQLTVLAGHTPRMYGVRPSDAQGRVDSAWYTWQPQGTVEWYHFIDTLARRLVPRRLSAEPGHSTDTLARRGQRFVRAWEVWSEADQNFYYGSWNRYLDMLRIARCTVRSYGRVPIVYGSCGHMTQVIYTFRAGCESYFDRVAYHPFGDDPDWELMHWYRNMPQQMICRGGPRETCFTECDFHTDSAEDEPGFILRLYATLKSWRERDFVRSCCTGGVFTTGDAPYSLVRYEDGRWVTRPAYVAFALARWLLDDAQYIGPLDAPEDVRLELFMRGGSPMVIAWTEGEPRPVELNVAPAAVLMDAVGARRRLSGPNVTIEVSQDAVAVLGVSMTQVAPAATAAIERVLTTELGHESPHNSRYIDTLEADAAACGAPDFAERVRDSVGEACDTFERNPAQGAAAFFAVQRAIGEEMLRIVISARQRDELRPLDRNTIWRLAQLLEQVGTIADGLGRRWWRMNNVTPRDFGKIQSRVEAIRERVSETSGGGECPFADRLLDRALERLDVVRAGGGHDRGAWWAATLQTRVAHALTGVEPPELRKVFVVGRFDTSTTITKGTLLPPDVGHVVRARVYNFLDRDLSGVVRPTLPEDWSTGVSAVHFDVASGEHSDLLPIPFDVPDEPRPWVQRTLNRPEWTAIKVDAPAPVSLFERMDLSLEAWGAPTGFMSYRLFLGDYPSKSTETAPEEISYLLASDSQEEAHAQEPAGGVHETISLPRP